MKKILSANVAQSVLVVNIERTKDYILPQEYFIELDEECQEIQDSTLRFMQSVGETIVYVDRNVIVGTYRYLVVLDAYTVHKLKLDYLYEKAYPLRHRI
jgi:hypothetical protein